MFESITHWDDTCHTLAIACLQEEVIEAIRLAVEQKLLASNSTRTFTQMQLPFAHLVGGECSTVQQYSATVQCSSTV